MISKIARGGVRKIDSEDHGVRHGVAHVVSYFDSCPNCISFIFACDNGVVYLFAIRGHNRYK